MTHYKELERPIIFIGNPRSGTTIISEIVMRHKDIGFPSQYQNAFPKNTNINYIRRLFDNRYWRFFGQKKQLNKVNPMNRFFFRSGENYTMWKAITSENIDFDRDFLLGIRENPETVEKMRIFFKRLVRNQGRKRLGFKITGPSRLEYLTSIFPDACIIRIQRKPVPTVSSLLKIGFWGERGKEKLWWTGPYTEEEIEWAEQNKKDAVALTALQIKKVTEETDKEIEKLKIPVLDIQYSDFVEDSEKIIKNILDYAGLPMDEACLDYMKKHQIHNRNRKDTEYFSEKDLNTINQIS
jgi:hypothetical protein